MRRIFKTTAITAIIASAFVFSSVIFAAATLVVDKPSVAVGDGYTLTLRVDRESPNVMRAVLMESGTPGWVEATACDINRESPCVFTWTKQKQSPGRFEYRAQYQYISRTGQGGAFGTTYVDGVVVTITDKVTTPPPTTLPACSSNNCSNLQTNCKCGSSDIGQTAQYCFNNQPFERQVDCQAAERATGGVPPPPSGGTGIVRSIPNPLGTLTFQQLLNVVINFIFWVGITLAPVIFIVAGFLYVTAAGSTQRLEMAKSLIIYTLIGLVVLLFARGLVAVLQSILGVTS